MKDELKQLQVDYNALCQRIRPCESEYTILTEREDVGVGHVEFYDGEYHYIVTERGLDLSHRSTADRREILYWMVYEITFWMGVAHEFKNRVEGPDGRRMMFPHWLEQMKKADQTMADRLEIDIARILAENPFTDHA
jgi:hypothetical protein